MNKNALLLIVLVISNSFIYAQEPTNFVGSYAVKEVVADLETSPVISNDDAADDICIYENVDSPDSSIIIATDKKYGLVVYNLNGQIINHYPFGRVNNVDIINKFDFKSIYIGAPYIKMNHFHRRSINRLSLGNDSGIS